MGKLVGRPFLTPEESPLQPLPLFTQRLPIGNNELHFLVCAGIGDIWWTLSKLWSVAQERDTVWWLPANEQKRGGDVFRLCGLKYGYMPDLTTEWIWSRPGSPPIPDTGAVLSIQPNRHLEHGHRIEKWYPEYEYRNPMEFVEQGTALYGPTAGSAPYVVGFMSQDRYMEYGGNLKPRQWARIFQIVEETVAPVVLIGAGKDLEFAEEVLKHWNPTHEPMFNAPLDAVIALFAGAQLAIGAHAGPLITSILMGVPTVQFYPYWLGPMAGSWEPLDGKWDWDYLDNAENAVRNGIHLRVMDGKPRERQMANTSSTLRVFFPEASSKWRKPEVVKPIEETQTFVADDAVFAPNGAEKLPFSWPQLAEADV